MQANIDSLSRVAAGGQPHADAIASITVAVKQWDERHGVLLAKASAISDRAAAATPAGARDPAFETLFSAYASLLNLERRLLEMRIARATAVSEHDDDGPTVFLPNEWHLTATV